MAKNLVRLADNLYVPEDFENNHYYFADAEGKKKYTGVTTVLGVLDKRQLVDWSARIATQKAFLLAEENHEVLSELCAELEKYPNISSDQIKKLGVKYPFILEAKNQYAKKRDDGAKKGTDTHTLVEEYVNKIIRDNDGYPDTSEPKELYDFASWAAKENIKFLSAETPLVSEKLWVAGTADLVFEKDGKTYIGDIKTYKKIWDRTPMYQCAGYALMWEEMERNEGEKNGFDYSKGGSRAYSQIDGYCIINLPKERKFDEEQDIRWSFDVEGDTKAFLACVELYKQNKQWK